MPTQFDLPVLSQKDYEKLFTQLRASIPRYSDNWTDYNDSDPGIALLQLLAWLGDVTLYRVDHLPRELYLNFARLVAGTAYADVSTALAASRADVVTDPKSGTIYLGGNSIPMDPEKVALLALLDDWQGEDKIDVQALRAACLAYWQAPYRAVTKEDFEALAQSVTANIDPEEHPNQKIMRAVVQPVDGRIRLVLVPYYRPTLSTKMTVPKQPNRVHASLSATLPSLGGLMVAFTMFEEVLDAARIFLAPRLPLGTALDVVAASRLPVSIEGEIAVEANAAPEIVLQDIYNAFLAWFDPVTGGPDGAGWPVGRPVAEYDLARPLASVAGIDHSQPLRIRIHEYPEVTLGQSVLGYTVPVGANPETGQPMIADFKLDAVSDTWPMQVGVHSRVAIDTYLPRGRV